MFRAIGLLLGVPALLLALFVGKFSEELTFVEIMLGIFAIVGFAVLATGWTVDHNVSD